MFVLDIGIWHPECNNGPGAVLAGAICPAHALCQVAGAVPVWSGDLLAQPCEAGCIPPCSKAPSLACDHTARKCLVGSQHAVGLKPRECLLIINLVGNSSLNLFLLSFIEL